MDKAEFMPMVLQRRIEDLRKVGYKVSYESNKDGQFTLTIRKNEGDKGSRHFVFFF